MAPSPWKGEYILVPWAEVSNTSQSDLESDCQQAGGGCSSPPTSSSARLSSSWAGSTQRARRKGTALSPQKWKNWEDFCCPGQLCWWGGERGSPGSVCMRGWVEVSLSTGDTGQIGCWSLMSHLRTEANPLPPRYMMVSAWCSNHQTSKFSGHCHTLHKRAETVYKMPTL